VAAPAKLTRSLRIVGQRPDGYHLLESEMVALELADELEIEALDEPASPLDEPASSLEVIDEVCWAGDGRPAAALAISAVPTGRDNLVLRALELAGRSAAVRLRKRIPAGAGLGGGSADAAAVLRWAGVTDPQMAVLLGADVPFCLSGGRALVRGVGELVEVLPDEQVTFLLCTPPLGVSTIAAYHAFDELGPGAPDPSRRNDLEHAALTVEPRLLLWRDLLADVTGHRPQLAGSGSTWFVELGPGVAADPATRPRAGERLVGELAEALSAAGARAMVALARTAGAAAPGER
jgi:4-diphosphocytidyl-2-C-methyl-D-erythritol kinase